MRLLGVPTPDDFVDHLYHYRGAVKEPFEKYVYDGDTFTVDLDLGLEITYCAFTVRPVGYDAPEVTGPEKARGREARAALIRVFEEQRALHGEAVVYLETLRNPDMVERQSGKRYLARVWIRQDGQLLDLATVMIGLGHG